MQRLRHRQGHPNRNGWRFQAQAQAKCLADHPTSPTTAENVQTAIPIRKMNACVSPEDVSNTRYHSVSSTMCVSCIRVFCDVQHSLKVSEMTPKTCFASVFVGWHFSGGGSILLTLHQIPLQPDQLSPKCLADHPTYTHTSKVLMLTYWNKGPSSAHLCDARERLFCYIIVQTYDVGFHSRRHPMEFHADTRPFASFDAQSS